MIYNKGTGELKNWIIEEEIFDSGALGKCESIFCQGNGYLGLRAAAEEEYENTRRSLLVAGTFDKMPDDATELPNAADVTAMDIRINGEPLDLTKGECKNYSRTLNLKNGILKRSFLWTSEKGDEIQFEAWRVVSLKDLHLIASKIQITALNQDISLSVRSGIDGDRIPAPVHFSLQGKQENNGMLNLTAKTNESGVLFSLSSVQKAEIGGKQTEITARTQAESGMKIYTETAAAVAKGETFSLTKLSNVFTTRDKGADSLSQEELQARSLEHLQAVRERTFQSIAEESEKEWKERIWDTRDILIDSNREEDQLAIRFAIYHLTIMTPSHDNRMNIGAKGFSGPGYKGHSFWDTEIFMLPYFIFSSPKEARSLLEHRYNSLEAAQKNAAKNGYKGAMYPWESAWITDGEVTPEWALTGLMEHHITADVAFGVYSYYTVSGDLEFMERYGYKMIFETAKFWISRLEYNEELDRYEINHVIGPDEYKEDVNNNAYTNYMAHLNIMLAVQYAESLRTNKPYAFEAFDQDGSLSHILSEGRAKAEKIYLPRENADGLVPEDDTFLTLRDIADKDYSLSERIEESQKIAGQYGYFNVQISKQADVMVLFFLLEDLFSPEIKKKNFYYYEKRCFHDSSLSLSTHSILANDLGEKEQAYKLYTRASMIDLGPKMNSSNPGIHAASLGGIWQCTVFGFGGVRLYGDDLRIQPALPDNWSELKAPIYWKGQRLSLTISHQEFTVVNETAEEPVTILNNGKRYTFTDKLTLPC